MQLTNEISPGRILTRPALVRMAKIDAEIRAGVRPNTTTLAKLLQVHPRTIQRDLDCLRDQLGAPISYDIHRRGFFYADATYRLALPQISEGECLALFLAERLLHQYRGLPCAADLQRLFQKIATLLPDTISLHAVRIPINLRNRYRRYCLIADRADLCVELK